MLRQPSATAVRKRHRAPSLQRDEVAAFRRLVIWEQEPSRAHHCDHWDIQTEDSHSDYRLRCDALTSANHIVPCWRCPCPSFSGDRAKWAPPPVTQVSMTAVTAFILVNSLSGLPTEESTWEAFCHHRVRPHRQHSWRFVRASELRPVRAGTTVDHCFLRGNPYS